MLMAKISHGQEPALLALENQQAVSSSHATEVVQDASGDANESVAAEDSAALQPASEAAAGGLSETGAAELATRSSEADGQSKVFAFRLGVATVWSDNILLRPSSEKESDWLFQPSGGLTISLGELEKNWFRLSYDAVGGIYLDHDDLNYLNHDANLNGNLDFSQGHLGFNASYRQHNEPDRESGRAYERNYYQAVLKGSREVGGKSVLSVDLGYQGHNTEVGSDADQLKGRLGLAYKVTPKTSLGVAGAYLFLQTDNDGDQTAQQALFTATHQTTEKLNFSLDAGVEFRQFDGANAVSDDTAFVFELESAYQLRERTRISVSGKQSSFSSYYLSNTRLENTTLAAALEQQIGNRFGVEIRGGYERDEYLPTRRNVSTTRTDDYWFARATLLYRPTTDISCGLFYEYADNDSTTSARSYESNRIGMQVNVSF